MADFKIPLIIRGEIIDDYSVEFDDRQGGKSFATAPVAGYIDKLVTTPESLIDLYSLNFGDIADYLEELGARLDLDKNEYWRTAYEVSCGASNLSRPVLEAVFRTSVSAFTRAQVYETAETRIGIPFLEGWVPTKISDDRTIEVRAVGARNVQIIAGNVPVVAVMTLIRNAITRSDAIVKVPSNDPFTMGAIARTMIDMAPGHPITKHISVAYWKGGDDSFEERLYHPRNIEKLIAWGGFASVKHVTKYIQPGIDLITLDPKSSTTLIGREAFRDDQTMCEVAARTAVDVGALDQEACSNARVVFIETGTDEQGLKVANRFGALLHEAVQQLPASVSNGPRTFDSKLKNEVSALQLLQDFYNVITVPKHIEQGAVIVSLHGEQVDFPTLISGRVCNLVPVDNIENAMSSFSASTQTVGIYPDSLRKRLRDRGALLGGQRFIGVGGATSGTLAAPHDGIEPERRMCRWIVDDDSYPAIEEIRLRLASNTA